MKTIGERVKEFRLGNKWSPAKMAEKVGTSRQNIENLEKVGDRKPHYIKELARVMGLTVDELMADEEDEPIKPPSTQLPVFTSEKVRPTLSEDALEIAGWFDGLTDNDDRFQVKRIVDALILKRRAKRAEALVAQIDDQPEAMTTRKPKPTPTPRKSSARP